jgi:hypothetical protein
MDKIGSTSIKFYFLTQINSTNSVDTKFSVDGAFWNNFHKVRSKSKDLVSMALSGITFAKYAVWSIRYIYYCKLQFLN